MARKAKPIISPTGGTPQGGELPHGLLRGIDRVMAVQRPIVVAHIRSIRRKFPDATPDQLVRILELRYLAAVTTGGAAVGATAVIPAIGTGVTLALSGVETAGFLEATALFAQSVAEVHGIAVDDPDRARALVMTLMLGREGSDLVRNLAGQFTGGTFTRNMYWGEMVTSAIPATLMGPLVDRMKTVFIRQFAVRGGASFIGKALPFGVGAAVGGFGNNILGKRVLRNARLAFGQAPAQLPFELEPSARTVQLRTPASRVAGMGTAVVRGGARVGSKVGGAVGGAAVGVGGAVGGAFRKALPRGRADADAGRTPDNGVPTDETPSDSDPVGGASVQGTSVGGTPVP
ncbi:hypothetical protein [Microterricola pindariensis]|uniref:Di-and tripeptidase n=1 Tax=Microterricola pindariensis TaxID=478010 RepID=A0ABX5AUP2_9MICO|nr:hypothetical protein GY24_11595 [Microterricola pindariensis]